MFIEIDCDGVAIGENREDEEPGAAEDREVNDEVRNSDDEVELWDKRLIDEGANQVAERKTRKSAEYQDQPNLAILDF